MLLNLGFLILGAFFTALIVDRLMKQYEESRWDDAQETAWKRLRAVATNLIQSIAIYYPDPKNVIGSPSFVSGSQAKMDTGSSGQSLYASPEWIKHISDEAIPAFQSGYPFDSRWPSLQEFQLEAMGQRVEACATDLNQCLMLFSQLLSPTQINRILELLDVIRSELPLVRVVMNETIHGGLMSGQPRPNLGPILTVGLLIIEEVNRKYPSKLRFIE